MPFLNKVSGKVSSAIETTKLNSKIRAEQTAINAVMVKIGEFYYRKYAETGSADEEISEFCAAIDGHNKAIADAKAEMERVKAANITGGLVCSVCGKASSPDRKFCAECGGKLEAEVKPDEAANTAGGLVCSVCGKPGAPDNKFCAECGGKLEAEVKPAEAANTADGLVCSACGKPGAPDNKFCDECGGKLEAAKPEKRQCECGAEVEPGVKFCGECGRTIT